MADSQAPASEPDPPDPWEDLKGMVDPITSFHANHPVYFWIALITLLGGVFAIGALVAPEIVIDRFLWKNFWGPTATDARQVAELCKLPGSSTPVDCESLNAAKQEQAIRATTDYTLLSEIVYGVILAGALVSIYQHVFKKRGIRVDGALIGAMLPYVFFGPLARAMEDASVFCQQSSAMIQSCDPGGFSWLFISPFIYLLTAAAVLVHLLGAHHSREMARSRKLEVVASWLGVQTAGYTFAYYALREQFVVMIEPWTFAGLALLAFGVYYFATERGGPHLHWALASWGLPMTLTPLVLTYTWFTQGHWVEPPRPEVPLQIPVVLATVAGVVALVALGGYLFRNRSDYAEFFLRPLNLGLVAGHMVDGFATFTAICSNPGGLCSGASIFGLSISDYGEKHPVSQTFLGFAEGWGFPIMKLILVLAIVMILGQVERNDEEDPDLIGLFQLAVLVLGLAPGTRNAIRVTLGI